jgi:hypothetical protein
MISTWPSNEALRDIMHASMHIPFYMNHTAHIAGGRAMDGGFSQVRLWCWRDAGAVLVRCWRGARAVLSCSMHAPATPLSGHARTHCRPGQTATRS